MHNLNDTIVAISSPPSGARDIVRLTGPDTVTTCEQIFSPPISSCVMRDAYREKGKTTNAIRNSGLTAGTVAVDDELKLDAHLYLFLAPHSYTGEDVAEIHVLANRAVTEAIVANLLGRGLRLAGPGEFTARAYLNGKIDLAQAEAVNEIVVSSNRYQLAAAEKLLSGRLGQISKKACSEIMDCLSLVEAGLDFSGEDIEFISEEKAVARLAEIKDQLEQLLSASIRYESVIDLPAVGIAGVPNAGKSSLLNKLLGKERSIVSDQRMTTRDVLTGELLLAHCRCVLFDCAGLDPGYWILDTGCSILDELAQQAAVQALRNSSVVVFCVDISKSDWDEDMAAYQAIRISGHLITCYPAIPAVIPVATKADLLTQELLAERLARLDELFGVEFLPVSVKTGAGLNQLVDIIDRKIIEKFDIPRESGLALTARLRTALTSAIENISDAINELKAGNDEVATMMLRAAYQGICDIEQPVHWQIDEQILEKIFSHFCIGK